MIFLVGGKGFVGSAYARLFRALDLDHAVITRENREAYRGRACDLLVNANGNSRKYLADREPLREFDESVRSVAETLEWYSSDRYVLLSSGDVYPDPGGPATTGEDQSLDPARQSRYGLHKSLAETLVRGAHPRHLVVRMGGFVGPGLKKNAVFDLMAGQPLWIDPASELQFIQTGTAAEIVWKLIGKGVVNTVVNIGGRGKIRLDQVRERLGSASPVMPGAKRIIYELDTRRIEGLLGESLPDSADEVMRFLDESERNP